LRDANAIAISNRESGGYGSAGGCPVTATTTCSYGYPRKAAPHGYANQTIGSIGLTPHNCGATVKFSRQLLLQAPGAEALVRNDLARTLGTLIDNAVLSGSGSAGQPLGVLNVGGIGSQSLTSTTWSTVVSMKSTLANANCLNDGSMGYLSNPMARSRVGTGAVRALAGSSSRTIASRVYRRMRRPRSQAPRLSALAGSDVTLASWGPGFEIVITPFGASSDFQAGIYSARIMASIDVGLRHLGAVVAGSNFT
jgi:hypothetical protein